LAGGSLVLCYLASNSYSVSSFIWWFIGVFLSFRFLANNLLFFYIFFELSLIPILIIIVVHGTQPERLSAGLYLLLYTRSLSIPYVLIVIVLLPSTSFFSRGFFLRGIRVYLMLLPFLVKMPILGLHFWLPKAHVEASTGGSMLLAGLLLKLGSYGAFRISF
jgi:NADH-ubiquinone oxidoreductase chain 4